MLFPNRFATILATVVLLASLSGCTKTADHQSGQSGTRKLTIGMVTFAGYAPLYLAKEKGFFGDLDVELVRIEEIPSLRAAMEKKELDAYLATPDIALDTNTQPPGKAVWAIDESAGGDGVVVSEGIRTLSGLKGKKVAAEPGLPPHFVLLYLLHKNGMSAKDIQLEDMTTQNAATAFVSKSVDGAGIYEPYLSNAKKQRKGSRIVISSADVPGLIVDLVFVRGDVLASRNQDVLQLISGWRKAMAYIQQDPADAYPIMAKSFNLSVNDFKDTVSGIHWLDLPQNRALFGTANAPGALFKNFDVVDDVLRRNRPDVFPAKAQDYLDRSELAQVK
jgi:NitT/TauT family transport system substrate-binding protein